MHAIRERLRRSRRGNRVVHHLQRGRDVRLEQFEVREDPEVAPRGLEREPVHAGQRLAVGVGDALRLVGHRQQEQVRARGLRPRVRRGVVEAPKRVVHAQRQRQRGGDAGRQLLLALQRHRRVGVVVVERRPLFRRPAGQRDLRLQQGQRVHAG
jgi:hypothetical protein